MEREPVTRDRIERFLRELGKRYRGGGRLYLVGGTQMVFAGFRGQTEDIAYTVQLEGDHQEFTGGTIEGVGHSAKLCARNLPVRSGTRGRS